MGLEIGMKSRHGQIIFLGGLEWQWNGRNGWTVPSKRPFKWQENEGVVEMVPLNGL
jgi:hypothetical protein